mmetsp:Transcript_133176/g.385300  ORF Transcript_133176/g.385300 Transcript_133176/m.385300 type:complete len:225 (+) Transcript_133176:172-846(+)
MSRGRLKPRSPAVVSVRKERMRCNPCGRTQPPTSEVATPAVTTKAPARPTSPTWRRRNLPCPTSSTWCRRARWWTRRRPPKSPGTPPSTMAPRPSRSLRPGSSQSPPSCAVRRWQGGGRSGGRVPRPPLVVPAGRRGGGAGSPRGPPATVGRRRPQRRSRGRRPVPRGEASMQRPTPFGPPHGTAPQRGAAPQAAHHRGGSRRRTPPEVERSAPRARRRSKQHP